MKKALKWRVTLLAATTVFAILFFLPSLPFFDGFPSVWKKVFPSKAITLGLDLQGGIHLVLDVNGDKAVENYVQRAADDIVNVLSQKEINNVSASRGATISSLIVKFQDTTKEKDITAEIKKHYPVFSIEKDQ